MIMHFGRAFRVAGWIFVAFGVAYLALGLQGALAASAGMQRPVVWPYVVLGILGVVVGTSILRWVRRGREDAGRGAGR